MDIGTQTMDDKAFTCCICYELALSPVTTTCGHLYCYKCIAAWFEMNMKMTCPVCKKNSGWKHIIPIYTNCDKHEMDRVEEPAPQYNEQLHRHVHFRPFGHVVEGQVAFYFNGLPIQVNEDNKGTLLLAFIFLLVVIILPW